MGGERIRIRRAGGFAHLQWPIFLRATRALRSAPHSSLVVSHSFAFSRTTFPILSFYLSLPLFLYVSFSPTISISNFIAVCSRNVFQLFSLSLYQPFSLPQCLPPSTSSLSTLVIISPSVSNPFYLFLLSHVR